MTLLRPILMGMTETGRDLAGWLRVGRAAGMLGVSVETLRRRITEGAS
jgi:hypothetical protein